MCDSISLIAWLDPMTDEEYVESRFPAKGTNDSNVTSSDFRIQYAKSPLTGAGFKITPIGMAIPDEKNWMQYGRIAGYQVDLNPPACLIGHNRQLVNGVLQAAKGGIWLLKYWLALNGCTQQGLDRINPENARLIDVTPTFLFTFESEEQAREVQLEFRTHTEALLNKKRKNGDLGRKVAYSYPPAPVGDAKYTYTSYVRKREFLLSAYVKESNQPGAFLLPLEDARLEARVQNESVRTLRLEVSVHGKWLTVNNLDQISHWKDNPEPYKKVFDLVRATLRLDEGLRTRRLKKTTVAGLKLCPIDKKFLIWHLSCKNVRDHPIIRDMEPGDKQNKYYSAVKRRIQDACLPEKIDIATRYDVQTQKLSDRLSTLLAYPDEFTPAEYLEAFVFSRTSLPLAIEKLRAIVSNVLLFGPDSAPPLPGRTIDPAPSQSEKPPERTRSISNVPVYLDEDELATLSPLPRTSGRSISNVPVDPNAAD